MHNPVRSTARFFLLVAFAIPALTSLGFCETKPVTANLSNQPFEANLPNGVTLRLHLHDGDFRIVGGDDSKISVRADGKNLNLATNIKILLKRTGDQADLKLSHVPKNELQVTITIPKSTNLYGRMRGGDLTVEGVAGDKDLQLTGGNMTIQIGNPADYAHVDLSVRFGDVSGDQFGDPKGWLGNSLTHEGSGKYRLHAHVFAGDLVLKN
jgi:hypothetical protein